MEVNPHDLLRIKAAEYLKTEIPLPDWALQSLNTAPYVVVRREENKNGFIPVGIRGRQRGQRIAAWIKPENVESIITPFSLADSGSWLAKYSAKLPEPVKTLGSLKPVMENIGRKWGPAGSTAFELATGVQTLKEISDLDIVLDATTPIKQVQAKIWLDAMRNIATVRLDIQLLTPLGGVSLFEFACAETVLVKTKTGPKLISSTALWL